MFNKSVLAFLALALPAGVPAQTISAATEPTIVTVANDWTRMLDSAGDGAQRLEPEAHVLRTTLTRQTVHDDTTSRGPSMSLAAAQAGLGQGESAERRGFIIGLGGGVSAHRLSLSSVGGSDFGTNSFAVLTDFKIGYAASDQILLFYQNRIAWTRNPLYDLIGMTGGGVTYMFKPTSPSAFVTGGFGIGVGSDILQTSTPERGTGFTFGGGYEFRRKLSVEGAIMRVSLGGVERHTVYLATLNFLHY